MPHAVDRYVVETIRHRLGTGLAELLEVMLDLGTPPLFLAVDDRPRMVLARARAAAALDDWAQQDPAAVADLAARLPAELRGSSPTHALLEAVLWNDYYVIPDVLLEPPRRQSRVFTAVPALLDRLDDDGLIDLTGLDATPHGLRIGNYALHYHQFLRRGYQSYIHYGLIDSILDAAQRHGLTARIAVDERRLRRADEYQEYFEADRWFGRPLSDDGLDSLAAVGETFHGDPDGGTGFLHPYAGLSVRWSAAEKPLKVVEVEEFMPAPAGDEGWIFARYLHAIRDTAKRTFIHCDGAVKGYYPNTYPRTQSEFPRRGKSVHYRKLFRVDGSFPVTAWSTLLSDWFRGNTLVHEYLNT